MSQLAVATIGLAFLVPNHYPPWISAWNESVAIAGLLGLTLSLALGTRKEVLVSYQLLAVAVICTFTIIGQQLAGRMFFLGDGVMALMFVLLWLIAVLAGRMLTEQAVGQQAVVDTLFVSWVFASIFSVAIALVQWTGALALGIYGAEMPIGGRPFGNLGQPNHLSTLCFLGLVGLNWLYQEKKLDGLPFVLATNFLLFGMALTQSRTGWLQVGLLALWALIQKNRAGLRISRFYLLMLGGGVHISGNRFATDNRIPESSCRAIAGSPDAPGSENSVLVVHA